MNLNSTLDNAKDLLAQGNEAAQSKIAGFTDAARTAAKDACAQTAESIDSAGAAASSAVNKGATAAGEFVDKNRDKIAAAGCQARNGVTNGFANLRSTLSKNPGAGILAGIAIGLCVAAIARRK